MAEKVYFACSKQATLQSVLDRCVEEIKHSFNDAEVTESNLLDWKGLLVTHKSQGIAYADVVSQHDHIVVLEHHGFLGKGLYDQLSLAGEMNKGRWVIRPEDGEFKIFVVLSIAVHDENNWRYQYGTVNAGEERPS